MWHPRIQLCSEHMQLGGVIAYPTEAVWGLGCDPFNPVAVDDILYLKSRPMEKGLILIAGEIAQIEFLLDGVSEQQRRILEQSWPGPVTWLIPHQQRIPAIVYGQHQTIAVRVSAHPVVKALCHAFGGPIVSTSANPTSRQPATTAMAARRYFGGGSSRATSGFGKTDVNVLFSPGVVGQRRKPSEIRDLATGEVIRAGS